MENSYRELIIFHFLEFVRKEKGKNISFWDIYFAAQKKTTLITDFQFSFIYVYILEQ